jgi:hypothetical protein
MKNEDRGPVGEVVYLLPMPYNHLINIYKIGPQLNDKN